MEEQIMKKHVTAVGAIYTGFGVLGLIASAIVFAALNFAKGFVVDDEVAYTVLKVISLGVPIFVAFFSTLGLVGGIGLLMLRPWARYLAIIAAALSCLIIPIGTLIGVYSLWVLFQNGTIKIFENKMQFVGDL